MVTLTDDIPEGDVDLNWVATLIAGVIGAGGAAVLQVLYTGRQSARKIGVEAESISAKTQPEVDSIAIQGAESSVLIMQGVNKALVEENLRLVQQITARDKIIDQLEHQLESYRGRIEEAETALRLAGEEYDALKLRIENLREPHPPTV